MQTEEQLTKREQRQKAKYRCQRQYHELLRLGKLQRPDKCSECGCTSPPTMHGHQEDYNKPEQVKWLCPSCHSKKWRQVILQQPTIRITLTLDPDLYKRIVGQAMLSCTPVSRWCIERMEEIIEQVEQADREDS